MGLFDSMQNLIGAVTGAAAGSVGDVLGGLADNQVVQDVQEQVITATDVGTNAASSVTENGQTLIDDVTQNLGL